jgi:hypothetical protein
MIFSGLTVILPIMELKDVLARVESRLAAVGLSAHAASMAAKKPDAIRNLRRAVQNGERRGVTTETLAALAPVLETTASWLLEGVSAMAPTSSTLHRRRRRDPAGVRADPTRRARPDRPDAAAVRREHRLHR